MAGHERTSPLRGLGGDMLNRHRDATAYQSTQLTGLRAHDVLHDIAGLPVVGARIAEKGKTYLVFATPIRKEYTSSLAVTLAIVVALLVLILTGISVVLILLLPLALVPFAPLLIDDRPQLAVGAVADDAAGSATRVTVHGRVWGDLGAALDAYLGSLPPPASPPATAASPTEPPADDSSPARGDEQRTGTGDVAT